MTCTSPPPHYDEPKALAFAAGALRLISFHGHADHTTGRAVTYVGGLETRLGKLIRAWLEAVGFRCDDPPADLSGTEAIDICNRNKLSRGVQIEMSRSQREQFYLNGSLSLSAIQNPGNRTDAFYRYADAVNAGITDLAKADSAQT